MRGIVSILFWIALVVLFSNKASSQSKDTTNAYKWFSGIRFQLTGGAIFSEPHYVEFVNPSPNSYSSNTLAGFTLQPTSYYVNAQVDRNLFRKSRKVSVYIGLGYNHFRNEFHGNVDSLAVYGLDTNILRKRAYWNNWMFIAAINAEKTFGFHFELGAAIVLVSLLQQHEQSSEGWQRTSTFATYNVTQSSLYLSLGYPLKVKNLTITPNIRADYFPGHLTRASASAGLILSIN